MFRDWTKIKWERSSTQSRISCGCDWLCTTPCLTSKSIKVDQSPLKKMICRWFNEVMRKPIKVDPSPSKSHQVLPSPSKLCEVLLMGTVWHGQSSIKVFSVCDTSISFRRFLMVERARNPNFRMSTCVHGSAQNFAFILIRIWLRELGGITPALIFL